jgi:hypothetical protein
MAELVDAPASGAGAGNGVEVRVLFRAPVFALKNHAGRDLAKTTEAIAKGRINRISGGRSPEASPSAPVAFGLLITPRYAQIRLTSHNPKLTKLTPRKLCFALSVVTIFPTFGIVLRPRSPPLIASQRTCRARIYRGDGFSWISQVI